MPIVLFGNILSFAGCTLMVLVGLIKDKRRILYTQCVQFTLQGAANLILGGTSGFIANIVSIVRNLVFSKWKSSLWLKIGFIILQLLLALSTLAEGAIALLPIASTVLFTWFIDTKSEVKLKIVIISTQILWVVYDFIHLNYVAVCFDCFTMISNFIGILMISGIKGKKR
ncbi:MAG: YgjV family protein [Oscillospiraceae bacterium]|nr:YgjV family protein [Oscillospiraceae bacterium]